MPSKNSLRHAPQACPHSLLGALRQDVSQPPKKLNIPARCSLEDYLKQLMEAGVGSLLLGSVYGSRCPNMENQMEKKMENEMETGIIYRFPNLIGKPKDLASAVEKIDLESREHVGNGRRAIEAWTGNLNL